MTSLGKTVKALRQKQALNQKALSALSGVSQATISRIETGRVRQLRSSALKNLADALGVSVDFLMGDNDVFASIPGLGGHGSGSIPGVREDRFRQIADTLDAFAIHENGRVLYVNQSFADMLGYRKEELLGKNGLEMATAPRSQAVTQRLLLNGSSDTGEILMVRKDGSVFPAELTSRPLGDNVRLAVVRDITARRCHQAVSRLQQVGLEVEALSDLGKVIRILADELEDMGFHFEATGAHLIHEPKNLLIAYYAFPEARGYRSFQDALPLQESLEQHAALRGLVSHWRRNKVWERQADQAFALLMQQTSLGSAYHPQLLVDVPFAQGTLALGLAGDRLVRMDDAVALLRELSHPLSFTIKRLLEIQTLRDQLQTAGEELQHLQRA